MIARDEASIMSITSTTPSARVLEPSDGIPFPQVLPERTHPHMDAKGPGAYLLSGTVVLYSDPPPAGGPQVGQQAKAGKRMR